MKTICIKYPTNDSCDTYISLRVHTCTNNAEVERYKRYKGYVFTSPRKCFTVETSDKWAHIYTDDSRLDEDYVRIVEYFKQIRSVAVRDPDAFHPEWVNARVFIMKLTYKQRTPKSDRLFDNPKRKMFKNQPMYNNKIPLNTHYNH
jgi:hypothetical protein